MNLEKKVLFGVLFVSFSLGFSSQNGNLYQHNKENSYPLTTVETYTNSTLLPYTSKNLQSFSNNTIVSSKTNFSEIEKSFNDRLRELGINQTLHQFGYNFFLKERLYNTDIPISNNYTLGPGDEIFIYVIGAPPNLNLPPILRVVVDRNGKIYVPNYGVFYVWGLTVKEVEEILSKSLGLNLKVTLGRLRSFPVYVSGEVNSPGPVVVTAANTLIDALSLAKGIKKTGTLRNIQISQQTSQGLKTVDIDLYQLLINGRPIDLKLSPGEVILVKTIGPVAAIAGNVRRPGIYELSGKETVHDLIEFAGGLSASAYKYKVIIQRYDSNKELKVIEGNLNDRKFLNLKLKDGDLLVIRQIKSLPANAVFIEGYVAYKGPYQYKPGLKLSQILTKDLLLPDTKLDYAEIQRYDLKTLQLKKIIKFKPLEVLKGVWDIKLQPLDKIIFYPKYAFEPVHISGCVKNPVNIPFREGLTLSEALAGVKFTTEVKKLKVVIYRKKEFLPTTNVIETNSTYKVGEPSQQNLNLNEYINSKKENRFSKEREPIKVVYLYKLLSEGVKEGDITLRPGDEIVVEKVKPTEVVEKVVVHGYVWKPGVYKIGERTTLYDVLKAAGGFRPGAYPKGIVILRKSIAKMQRERLQKAIALMKQTLEKEEASLMQADLTQQQVQAYKYAFEAKRRLLQEMEKTQVTGRIVGLHIPANLEALKYSPSNIVLEDGDQIYVPKVPSAVMVFGEVFNPSAILYRPNLTVKDYIQLAGGFTKYADIENVFIIKANGVAISSQTNKSLIEWDKQHKRFIWGYAYNDILDYKLEPGDAVIVPTKVKVPVFWRPLIKDVVQIIYQSALTVYTISKL